MANAPEFFEQTVPFLNVPLWYLLIPICIGIIIYLLLTRKPKKKEFKELNLKKETKRLFDKEYSYFGEVSHKFLYDVSPNEKQNKIGYVKGLMKVVWNEQYKRYVPIFKSFDKIKLWEKINSASMDIYKQKFADLDDAQKKNIAELAKEEIRDEQVDVIKANKNVKIVRGKREEKYSVPYPVYCLKVCSPNIISRVLALALNVGCHYFLFDENQLSIGTEKIELIANFPRKIFNDVFIFSPAGKNIVQDIAFQVDREEQLKAIANETSKVTFFDTGLGMQVEKVREAYKLEAEKHKAQSESHEMG